MKDLEKLDFNIFLIGFMGVGKSTVSKALQRMFAMDVVEMDEIIAKRNGIKARAYYCGCNFDVAKTIKRAIDYLTMAEDFKYAREVIG